MKTGLVLRWNAPRLAARLAAAFIVVLLLNGTGMAGAEEAYETPQVLDASNVLPPELLTGPYHKVESRVTNDGFLNTYTLSSEKFGTFTAVTTPTLRKRIGELRAMTVMESYKGTKVYLDSAKDSAKNDYEAVKSLLFHPVDTMSGAVGGVGAVLQRAGDTLLVYKRSQTEDSRLKDVIGFSKSKREHAFDLGVDVYSRNEKMQEMLNDVAWADYLGGITIGAAIMAVPGGAGIALTITNDTRLMNSVFRTQPPVALRRMNEDKLRAMGLGEEQAELFINNTVFTPRNQTILVGALDSMKNVVNKSVFVDKAATTTTPVMADFRQRQAEMYANYHRQVAPLAQFVPVGDLVAAQASDGTLVFNLPVDYMVWTESLARLTSGIDEAAPKMWGVKKKQLWITGTLSPMARQALQSRKWEVHENAQKELLPLVEKYPEYTKREQQ